MAPRKTSRLVAETPELDHSDTIVLSGDGKIDEEKPAKLRHPVLNGGNAFEVVTSLSRPSPVTLRVRVWRYTSNAASGSVIATFDIPTGQYTHYHPINVDLQRREQLAVGYEPIGSLGSAEPADGVVTVIRVAT